jgi:hypothetical protein
LPFQVSAFIPDLLQYSIFFGFFRMAPSISRPITRIVLSPFPVAQALILPKSRICFHFGTLPGSFFGTAVWSLHAINLVLMPWAGREKTHNSLSKAPVPWHYLLLCNLIIPA